MSGHIKDIFLILAVFFLIIANELMPSSFAQEEMAEDGSFILPGDFDDDGKITLTDSAVLYKVIYEGKKIPSAYLDALDVNNDGKANIDDLVALNKLLSRGEQPSKRLKSSKQVIVIPRYADQAWWVNDRLKAATVLKMRLKELDRYDMRVMTLEADRILNSLNRDVEAAAHYGAVCSNDLLSLRKDISRYRNSVLDGSWDSYDDWEKWINSFSEESDYVKECSRRMPPGPHTIKSGLFDSSELCFKGILPHLYTTSFHYVVESKPNGRIKLTMPFRIELASDFRHSDEREFYNWWQQNTACARDFWSRYGVELELITDQSAAAQFYIHSGYGRSDSSNLYFKDWGPIEDNPCLALLHEFGHRMGLFDNYMEPSINCPGRNPEKADLTYTVMGGAVSKGNVKSANFTRNELRTIFGSVCKDVR